MFYQMNINDISTDMLDGFFVGWVNQPSQETHLQLLQNSNKVIIAIDENTDKVVGFITAVSDGVLSAYIPLYEVLPEYQNKGIGKELIQRMLRELDNIYMVDLMCDENMQPYYERFNMTKSTGMIIRNYSMQKG